jgi:hypothetical protein
MNELRMLTPANCRFSRSADGLLRVEIAEVLCVRQAVLRRLFPLRDPQSFISVADGKEEVGIIEDVSGFDSTTRRLIQAELDFFYAVPEILEIELLKEEFGYFHWKVKTDRGSREFFVKGRTENVRWLHPAGMIVTDIHNSRYQIPDPAGLSPASRHRLDQVY